MIKNKLNDKIYIGSSIDIKNRICRHKSMLRGGYHDNTFLQNSFNLYKEENFTFEQVELCKKNELVYKENYFINLYNSNNMDSGYNLCKVNINRRNKFNTNTKVKMSKNKLKANNNFSEFVLINIETGVEVVFDNLVDAAIYIKENKFSKGKLPIIRQNISEVLRGIEVNTGRGVAIRRSAYKYKCKIVK